MAHGLLLGKKASAGDKRKHPAEGEASELHLNSATKRPQTRCRSYFSCFMKLSVGKKPMVPFPI